MAKKGDFVSIKSIILEPGQRATNIPIETLDKPLEMYIFGHLLNDSNINEIATIKTKTGRIEKGILEEIEPIINIDYGNFVKELDFDV